MSGYEPGRPKIEEREAALIWTGTRVLTDAGVEWTVTSHRTLRKDRPTDHGRLMLNVVRKHGSTMLGEGWVLRDTDLIRCRVEDEDR